MTLARAESCGDLPTTPVCVAIEDVTFRATAESCGDRLTTPVCVAIEDVTFRATPTATGLDIALLTAAACVELLTTAELLTPTLAAALDVTLLTAKACGGGFIAEEALPEVVLAVYVAIDDVALTATATVIEVPADAKDTFLSLLAATM